MLLSFKRNYPWGGETNFVQKIIQGEKIHTFRIGDRWRPGMFIDFWDESPRNKWADPKPEWFGVGEPAGAKKWSFHPEKGMMLPMAVSIETWEMRFSRLHEFWWFTLVIGGVFKWEAIVYQNVPTGGPEEFMDIAFDKTNYESISDPCEKLETIAKNDGLELLQFVKWFDHSSREKMLDVIKGQIIHWTDKAYCQETAWKMDEEIGF